MFHSIFSSHITCDDYDEFMEVLLEGPHKWSRVSSNEESAQAEQFFGCEICGEVLRVVEEGTLLLVAFANPERRWECTQTPTEATEGKKRAGRYSHILILSRPYSDYRSARDWIREYDGGCHKFSKCGTSKKKTVEIFSCRSKVRCSVRAEIEMGTSVEVRLYWAGGRVGETCAKCPLPPSKNKKIPADVVNKTLELRLGGVESVPFTSNTNVVRSLLQQFPDLRTKYPNFCEKSISNIKSKYGLKASSYSDLMMQVRALSQDTDLVVQLFNGSQCAEEHFGTPQYAARVYALKESIPLEDQLFVFLGSRKAMRSLGFPLLAPLSTDYVHKIRRGNAGIYTFTVGDATKKQFLLGVQISFSENRLGYFFGLSCLQRSCAETLGIPRSSKIFRTLVVDGVARVAMPQMAQALLSCEKVDCLFHAASAAKKSLGSSYFRDIQEGLHTLVRSPLPEHLLRHLSSQFREMCEAYIPTYKAKAFKSWADTYLPGRTPATDGALSKFFGFFLQTDLFTVGDLHCVAEAFHSSLRAQLVDLLPEKPQIHIVLNILGERLFRQTTAPKWRLDPPKDMWMKVEDLQICEVVEIPNEKFKLTLYFFSINRKEGEAESAETKRWLSFRDALAAANLSFRDALRMIVTSDTSKMEKIFDLQKCRGGLFSIFLGCMHNFHIVSVPQGYPRNMKCSCKDFWKFCGCAHSLLVGERLHLGLSQVERPIKSKLTQKTRVHRKMERRIYDVPKARFENEIFTVPKQLSSVVLSQSRRSPSQSPLWDTPNPNLLKFKNNFSSIRGNLFASIMANCKEFPISRNCLSMKINYSCIAERARKKCKPAILPIQASSQALRKCRAANILVDNDSSAEQIWTFHEKLQNLTPEKYKVTEDVPGDGDCFFHAIIRRIRDHRPWLPPHLLTPQGMRLEIVKVLKREEIKHQVSEFMGINGKPGEKTFEKKYEAHLRNISGSMWADHIMCFVVCQLYGITLKVVHDTGHIDNISAYSSPIPSLRTLDEIVSSNEGCDPTPMVVELGNINHSHFVLIERDGPVDEQSSYGRGRRKPRKKLKYGYDV